MFVIKQKVIGIDALMNEGFHKFDGNINQYVDVERYVSLRDIQGVSPPEHLPASIEAAFREAASCLAIGCPNAAATMFRLCVDIATRDMLPEENIEGLNSQIRFSLGKRLHWLFETRRLPQELRALSNSVKEDGNDGAHAGTLTKVDAEDLLDFSVALLQRLFTEPARLRLAEERRDQRRNP